MIFRSVLLLLTCCFYFADLPTGIAQEQIPLPAAPPEPVPGPSQKSSSALMNPLSQSPGRKTVLPNTNPSPVATGLEHRERLDRIRRIAEKLRRLRKLASEARAKDQMKATDTKPVSTTQATAETTPEEASSKPTSEATTDDTSAYAATNLASSPPPQEPPQPTHLTSTVDSLALANNLFVQGKLELAAPIYERLARSPQEANDVTWIQYQLASCYRMQDRGKDAIKLYRIVASSKSDEYWATRAQWWLKYLDRAQSLADRQQQVQSKLDSLRKDIDGLQAE